MRLVDTVRLATTTSDGYGDRAVQVLDEVPALFVQRTGVVHSQNTDAVLSDAAVYLDPEHPTVIENSYRLEGMYVIAQPFGQLAEESWYQITSVNVGQRKLLDNTVDNIYCRLKKVAGLAYDIS